MEQECRTAHADEAVICPYCMAKYTPDDWSTGGAHDFRISDGVLYYFDATFGWEGVHIKYCPFCGRKLRVEPKHPRFCDNQQLVEDGEYVCLAHLVEGRTLNCPYTNKEDRRQAKYPCMDFEEIQER